jgi:hypothetical protein
MTRLLWTQRANFGPPGRFSQSMVYDTQQQRILLWGGERGAQGPLGDTWEWDGTNWTQVADMGPFGSGAMAYDDDRSLVVLVDETRNTWEWDGSEWTQVAAEGPVLTPGAVAYDKRRKRTVAFEASFTTTGASTRTWEWDGVEWTQVADTGPGPRSGHTVVRDDARNCLVLFGGSDLTQTTSFGDTWTWDGQRWQQQAAFGPAARAKHAMANDAGRSRVVLFGGASSGEPFGDTWDWDGTRWVQVQDMGPLGRKGHAMAYDAVRKRIVLFSGLLAGTVGRFISDTWELIELS